jgi:hypothetical protein
MKWMDVELTLVFKIMCPPCLIFHNLGILLRDNFNRGWIREVQHDAHDNLNAPIIWQWAPKREIVDQDSIETFQSIQWAAKKSLNHLLESTNDAFQISMKSDEKILQRSL